MLKPLIILSLFILISCGSSKEEKTESAIDLALTYLSSDECEKALKALEEGADFKNPIYLQVLASVYACKAEISSIEVISELDGFVGTQVLNEISIKSFAISEDLTSIDFMSKSLDIIFSSTPDVSQASREKKFGKRKGQDLGMQGLMYSVVQVAKFVNYFGNTENGEKGDGAGVNTCFLDYSNNPTLINFIIAPNKCQIATDGHPALDLNTVAGRKYACHGITIINNSLDVLGTIEFGNSEELKAIKRISEQISLVRDFALTIDPSLVSLFEIRDQETCLALTNNEIQMFILAFYENGFK